MTQPKTKLDDLNLVNKFLFDESMDVEHTIYYTEMQKNNTYNLSKRSRYYQALMDVSLLEPGSVDFNRLNDTCFIFIAPFDIFGRGLYRYTFEGVCRECPDLKLGDGALRIFINTKGKNREDFSQEFLDFMDYITSSIDEVAERSQSEKIKTIHERVKQIKLSEKMGVKHMQRWEEKIMDREEGRREGTLEILYELVEKGLVTLEYALVKTGLSEVEFLQMMRERNESCSKQSYPNP